MKKSLRWKRFHRKLRPSTDVIRDRFLQVEGATLSHAHKFLVRRWKNLREVREFAAAWLLIVVLLIAGTIWQFGQVQQLYSVSAPAKGGTYSEGVFGAIDNLNPIFASTPAERAVSHLVFDSLLSYNDQNQLVGNLADKWQADDSGRVYTVTLRPNLRWHDGATLTARDVAFTFNLIKNADAKSPLYSSWRTISVEATSDNTVVFTLPGPYAPFPNALTVGILPEHVLGSIPASQMRNSQFSQQPTVGSGPFQFKDMRAVNNDETHVVVHLAAYKSYYRGAPRLDNFNIDAFSDGDQLVKAYQSQEVAALSDTAVQNVLQSNLGGQHSESSLFNGVFAFMKMSNPILQDVNVRSALALATDRNQIVKKFDNLVKPLYGPLLPGQLGYSDQLRQPDFNKAQAEQILDADGWVKGKNGIREKNGQPLQLQLVSVSDGDYPTVVQQLLNQWSAVGVDLQTQLVKPDDFQQTVILPHTYDVLVYELAIGNDPDVYAYWDSSQAGQRGLNLSEYKSNRVDDALETARVQSNPVLREAKYHAFVQQWIADSPAVALYQPSLLYIKNANLTSFTPRSLPDATDRYSNVLYWSADKTAVRSTP